MFAFRFDFRDIETVLGFQTEQILACCSHSFCRLIEKCFFYTSNGGNIDKKKILNEIFQENWHLKSFKFIKKENEEDEEDVDPNNHDIQEKISMITGNALNFSSQEL